MDRRFYYFAILLFAILILQEVLLTAVLTYVGKSVYALGSFTPYFILVSATQICCSAIALLYCCAHQYTWPFRAGWLYILLLFVHTAVVYEIIAHQTFQSWYYYSSCALSAANLLLGVSLVFSKSREHFWLKWIGIASICLATAQIILMIWYAAFADFQMKAKLGQVNLVLGWLMVAVTGLWIVHFVRETKRESRVNDRSWSSMTGIMLVSVAIGWFTISCGANFYNDSIAPLPSRMVSAKERAAADRFEAHFFVSLAGEQIPYRLMKPLEYDSTRKYPIVLCLHHGGAHGRDNVAQVEGSYALALAHYDNRRNHPAFLLVPQCEEGKSWMDPDVDAAIMELMASLEKQNSIDTLRRYVIGESGGGYGSWHFIGNHPGKFAAAIPVCGGGEEALVKNMANVSIWAFHGSKDVLVPVSYSRKMVKALRAAGSKARYTEFAGATTILASG